MFGVTGQSAPCWDTASWCSLLLCLRRGPCRSPPDYRWSKKIPPHCSSPYTGVALGIHVQGPSCRLHTASGRICWTLQSTYHLSQYFGGRATAHQSNWIPKDSEEQSLAFCSFRDTSQTNTAQNTSFQLLNVPEHRAQRSCSLLLGTVIKHC